MNKSLALMGGYWKMVLLALVLALLLAFGPVASDAALHTGYVPAAQAVNMRAGGG